MKTASTKVINLEEVGRRFLDCNASIPQLTPDDISAMSLQLSTSEVANPGKILGSIQEKNVPSK